MRSARDLKKLLFAALFIGLIAVFTVTGVHAASFDTGTGPVYGVAATPWETTHGGSDRDHGRCIQQTSDGGYIITGGTYSSGAGSSDVYLIKTDADGGWKWEKTFGGDDVDMGWDVQETSDGGYIIAGYTLSMGEGGDVYLIKTNEHGDWIWDRNFGGSESDSGYSVQQTTDGGYIIAGDTYSSGEGGDVFLIKTYPDGVEEWSQTFGGSGGDGGRSVHKTADGGYIIAGITRPFGSGSYDVYFIKTDDLGNGQWSRTFGGGDNDLGFSVRQTTDLGYIIAGSTKSFGAGQSDVYLIQCKPLDDPQPFRIFNDGTADLEIRGWTSHLPLP